MKAKPQGGQPLYLQVAGKGPEQLVNVLALAFASRSLGQVVEGLRNAKTTLQYCPDLRRAVLEAAQRQHPQWYAELLRRVPWLIEE